MTKQAAIGMPADKIVGESEQQYRARQPAPALIKTFAGNKPLSVIKKQCAALGIEFNDRLHRKSSSDYVVIRSIKGDSRSGEVLFNSYTGNFFGTTNNGVSFDSHITTHEAEPWFQTLLSFFYIEKPAIDAATQPTPKAA